MGGIADEKVCISEEKVVWLKKKKKKKCANTGMMAANFVEVQGVSFFFLNHKKIRKTKILADDAKKEREKRS